MRNNELLIEPGWACVRYYGGIWDIMKVVVYVLESRGQQEVGGHVLLLNGGRWPWWKVVVGWNDVRIDKKVHLVESWGGGGGGGGGCCHSTEEDEEDCCFSFSSIVLCSLPIPTTNNQYQVYLPPAALGLGLLLAPDAGCCFCLSRSAVHCLLFLL